VSILEDLGVMQVEEWETMVRREYFKSALIGLLAAKPDEPEAKLVARAFEIADIVVKFEQFKYEEIEHESA